jgi:predicted kinase
MQKKYEVINGRYNFKYENRLMFLVGNIGSGKTTYIKQLNGEYVVLSRDKIRYMLGNGEYVFHGDLEDAVWQAELKLFTGLLHTGINIVIDEVNTNPNMRARYLYAVNYDILDFKYETTAVVFPRLPMDVCVERRVKSPHGNFTKADWEKVWTRFDTNYVKPSINEGFDKVVFLDKSNKKIKQLPRKCKRGTCK